VSLIVKKKHDDEEKMGAAAARYWETAEKAGGLGGAPAYYTAARHFIQPVDPNATLTECDYFMAPLFNHFSAIFKDTVSGVAL
jgi:hypothetical protein